LRERYAQQDIAVVIAYDVRVFNDLRGLYARDLPNPLLGMTSRDFAQAAAGVYTANGVRVYMLPEHTTTYMSTPELSFAVRYVHATAGLNISASHNHPDDNGGKFYNDRGAQEVPPNDEAMARQVERVSHIDLLDFAAAKATGLISWIRPDVHAAYVALNMERYCGKPDFRSILWRPRPCLTARFRPCRIAPLTPRCRNPCSRAWSWPVR
jgi:phosphoglucomutase/phosphomannomutase